jgi:hypothetical protein
VHVCPLIPLLFCESPPELAIELTELAVWLVEIYKGSPKSLGDTWSSLVGLLSTAATAKPRSDDRFKPGDVAVDGKRKARRR